MHRIVTGLAFGLTLVIIGLSGLKRSKFVYPSTLAGLLFLVEGLLGKLAISPTATPLMDALHLSIGFLILSLLVASTVAAYSANKISQSKSFLNYKTAFSKLILALAAATLLLMISGQFLIINDRSQVCSAWPFCNPSMTFNNLQDALPFIHSLFAGLSMILMIMIVILAWTRYRNNPLILTSSTGTMILFVGQVLMGALKVSRGFPADLVAIHSITTVALWSTLCVLLFSVGVNGSLDQVESFDIYPAGFTRQRLKDFFLLTKPVIVALLLVTTLTGMVMGGKNWPSLPVLFWTITGGALAAGGSSAINQYIDRELDKHMQRTAKRPVASGRLTPAEGLAFGVGLCLLSFYILAGFVNLLAAILSLAGMVYYILIYSILLKKATVQNIVIGGGAGAIPPLVGWAAVTGSLNIPSIFLFAIVFFWTPPHFWALALVRAKDYARAGVPMLPVVKGERETRVQIWIYTLELVILTLLMPVFRLTGSLYLISAITLGGLLIYAAWTVYQKGGNKSAWRMYRYSSMYLALLFLAMILDVLIKKSG